MENQRPLPREAVLIVNAHSRRGQDMFDEATAKLEMAGVRLIASHALRNPKKLVPTVRQAVWDGAPMVIVGGGDGSLSYAVDEFVGRDCVFALLPLGTANSFSRTLGVPLDLDGAIDVIAHGERRRIDLGVIDGDYFTNCAAMGLSPMIGEGIPHKLKRYLGRVGYLLWAIWCLMRFHAFRLTVDDGEKTETIWATEVRIANGSYHGGVELIESATVDSGMIVVQAVAGRTVLPLIWNWVASMLRLPARQGPVQEFRGKSLKIATRPRQPISIDGEVLAKTPITARIATGVIEVAAPATKGEDEGAAEAAA
ncbi:MAG TPA: diacylglycerol kinase family protein [Allosphingosinicella sp.]|jgi:YegS/Rv2252/BmrU family lipid kinase